MEKDREKWNEKYLKIDGSTLEPSDIVKNFYHLAKKGKALDIATGLGRNAIFLAEKGFIVDAVDISDVAINKLKQLKHPNINPIQADLDFYNLKNSEYDLIVNINFLNRRLFPLIKEALKPDGVLIFETFLMDGNSHIKTKDYLLRPNELIHCFIDMRIVFYQEKTTTKITGEKSSVASLIAVKKCKLI